MFESDDFDQLDLPEPCDNSETIEINNESTIRDDSESADFNTEVKCLSQTIPAYNCKENNVNSKNMIILKSTETTGILTEENKHMSPKHTKRKLINSYFDHKSKRKFPGPAGLLNGTFEESKEDDICHMELLSQDIDYTQSFLHKGIFESPLWARLLQDTKDLYKVDTIKSIKQQALKGNLRRRKAEAITAYVESVDRSDIDPLIVIRDTTENIKCTLHRDAWVAFSPYIVSECCALVLHSPTVLTTGSAFKKHYLNITLSNIAAVYSSSIIKQEDETFPPGFSKIYEEDYTIIKNEKENTEASTSAELFDDSNLLDGLDGAFSDDLF
ncbi:homologous recombination OB-fold protein-like isoform X2 [Epargyreus clarus]|uniref:homologous recombination OB-fold protein-like isoform X2 n=1 Tax=Epargyreus clarus TaxID=520877 RepID=UPI003C2E1C3C